MGTHLWGSYYCLHFRAKDVNNWDHLCHVSSPRQMSHSLLRLWLNFLTFSTCLLQCSDGRWTKVNLWLNSLRICLCPPEEPEAADQADSSFLLGMGSRSSWAPFCHKDEMIDTLLVKLNDSRETVIKGQLLCVYQIIFDSVSVSIVLFGCHRPEKWERSYLFLLLQARLGSEKPSDFSTVTQLVTINKGYLLQCVLIVLNIPASEENETNVVVTEDHLCC